MELVLFVGLQASGKTSFFRARLAASHLLVSKDLLPVALHVTRRKLRWPSVAEGFDALYRVRLLPPAEFAVEPLPA